MAFHIYDALGRLVADSGGDAPVKATMILAEDGEVLLDIPAGPNTHIRYHLYSRIGRLLTTSDGDRTQIFSHLKMESHSVKYGAVAPARLRLPADSLPQPREPFRLVSTKDEPDV